MSPVTALLPVVGLPFTAAAYFANRRHAGFHRTISRMAFVASVLVSIAVAWTVFLK